MNWHSFDLNLLPVFEAVMQENNLTRAGRRLGMSQPAVSHALGRLRHLLKDELFVCTPEGMRPTPRAQRMLEPVRAALQELRVTLEDDEFDASRATRHFTIAANNYAAQAVIPVLASRVANLAPSVVLEVRPVGMLDVLDQLDGGSVELVLSTLVEGGDRFKCIRLLEDEHVVTLASNHPTTDVPELSLERFASLPHIASTSSGDNMEFIDDALAERGFVRSVFRRVPLHSLISVLIGSSALAVMPRRIAVDFAATRPLAMRRLPFPSPRLSLSMIWHRRLDSHAAHRWLRATVRASVAEM